MSSKLKISGAAIVAALAISGIAVLNASATVAGHFESEVAHTILVGSEGHEGETIKHTTEFHVDGGNGIVCDIATYSGTVDTITTTQVTVTPTYDKCHTTGAEPDTVEITMNECDYTFFSHGSNEHGTIAVDCKTEKDIEIHHPNCTITVGPQTISGATYTQKTASNGKHELTVDLTVKGIKAEYHGGICIFIGTEHTGEMTGAVTLKGTDTEGKQVHVTHT